MPKRKNESVANEAEVTKKGESAAKAEYRKILEAYKLAYPEKWEERKERLLAKLETL